MHFPIGKRTTAEVAGDRDVSHKPDSVDRSAFVPDVDGRVGAITRAIEAIHEDQRTARFSVGDVACPACETGRLRYVSTGRRALRAQCSTPGCLRFMS